MKVIRRIFEKQSRNVVKLDGMQMRFMSARKTVDGIFILWQVLGKYDMAERKSYFVFVDLEKIVHQKGDLVGTEKIRFDGEKNIDH